MGFDPRALEFAGEELCPSVSEAPIGIRVRNNRDDDITLYDTTGLQFLNELRIEVCLLLLGSLSACDPDEDNVLGAIDTEPGVLNDEVRFGVLLIDLVAVTQRYSKGRKDGPVDCVKKFLNLFLATSFVGIDSKKGHSMFLLLESWHVG